MLNTCHIYFTTHHFYTHKLFYIYIKLILHNIIKIYSLSLDYIFPTVSQKFTIADLMNNKQQTVFEIILLI